MSMLTLTRTHPRLWLCPGDEAVRAHHQVSICNRGAAEGPGIDGSQAFSSHRCQAKDGESPCFLRLDVMSVDSWPVQKLRVGQL